MDTEPSSSSASNAEAAAAAAAKPSPPILDRVPPMPWFGMDIGGTLTKLVYFEPTDTPPHVSFDN